MPVYTYQVILPDGTEGEVFEVIHPMNMSPLTFHPETGLPVKRVYTMPEIGGRYAEQATKRRLENSNLEKKGFTKYVRDKASGTYHKEAGREGPDTFKVK